MKIINYYVYNKLNKILGISKINEREVFINILDEYCDIDDEPFSGMGLKWLYDNYDEFYSYYIEPILTDIEKSKNYLKDKDNIFINITDIMIDKSASKSLRIFYAKLKIMSSKDNFNKGELYKLQNEYLLFYNLYNEEYHHYDDTEYIPSKREYYQ